jgi:hypothetical protein
MTAIVSKNPYVQQVADGTAKIELIEMILQKQMPFTDEEYLESLVFLLKDENHKITAVNLLKDIGENVKATYVDKAEANHRVAYYVMVEALNRKSLTVISKAIRNQSLPYEFLLKIAEHGDATMLEVLLDNQIKLIAYPEIMVKIEGNKHVTNFIKGKIKEIREFYLENVEVEEIPEDAVLEDVKELIILEAEEEVKKEEKKEEEGEEEDFLLLEQAEEKALTTLQEINRMSISDRIKLALTGSKTQRLILIKDSNKMVANAVVESPKIGIDEVALLARNKSVAGEIITKIARKRDWIKNYIVIYELVHNPKTPVKDALSFVKKLHIRDLQSVSRDKNINPVVRQLAINFYKQKTGISK